MLRAAPGEPEPAGECSRANSSHAEMAIAEGMWARYDGFYKQGDLELIRKYFMKINT